MLFEIEHEMVEFDRGVSRLKHKPVLRAAAFVELRETHPFCGESLGNTQRKWIGHSILLDSLRCGKKNSDSQTHRLNLLSVQLAINNNINNKITHFIRHFWVPESTQAMGFSSALMRISGPMRHLVQCALPEYAPCRASRIQSPKTRWGSFWKKAGKITKQQCPIYPSLPFRGFYGKSLGRNDGNFQQVMEGDKKNSGRSGKLT